MISIVVAMGANNEIGAKGDLLWKLPKDMEHFKKITIGHTVLMGRKTYKSIPIKFRPLAGRENYILTRQDNLIENGCNVITSIDSILNKVPDSQEIMVIGGGEIYKELFPICTKIYLTKVHQSFPEADTFFPEINAKNWLETSSNFYSKDEKNIFDFEIKTLEKI